MTAQRPGSEATDALLDDLRGRAWQGDLAQSGPPGALVLIYENGNSWVTRGYSAPNLTGSWGW